MLLPHEFDAMLQALRRDMRRELELAAIHKEDAAWHMTNARMAKRLLETLNPKQRHVTFSAAG
ncbi:hypothetical protein [Noviherbaspirillum denitrificans]|uniref:Uncharacterized protein n=1 Tax=Noviherbaspirillum denitrificans TaxID=1968433 RepID=A0A254TFC7_9BURK|nr:hypothetical protein [Noviherbaspirillum denitrificans]OWW19263.1 hypothetical protein AYR66_06870 [Noviherbaspirillum denitrificans]